MNLKMKFALLELFDEEVDEELATEALLTLPYTYLIGSLLFCFFTDYASSHLI